MRRMRPGASTNLRRALALGLLAPALAAAPASAQLPAPSLTPDSAFAPPTGIAKYDFNAGTSPDITAGVAVAGDRIYTVGETRASTGDANIAILARRPDGTFDPGFSEDGRHTVGIAVGAGRDAGTAIAVLPDGRLRVLAATDVDSSSATNLDVAVVGLNPDGSDDTTFGGGDGRVTFPVGSSNDTPTRLAVDAGGRIAITGTSFINGRDDFFVSMRESDGSPSAFAVDGVRTYNRAGVAPGGISLNDRGVDVAFRPGGGIVALLQVETNPDATLNDWTAVVHAFDEKGGEDNRFAGDGDMTLEVGNPDTLPGGILAYGDRLFVTGSTKVGQDTDAFLARMQADGSGMQARRFDMRGRAAATAIVISQGVDLDIVPGTPATLVVGGSVTTESGTTWASAAFNALDGDLAAAGFGEALLSAPGQGTIVGVAASPNGWAAVAGSLLDSTIADTSFGTARLLVDVEKACDLVLGVVSPLEIVFSGRRPATLKVRVTNTGTRTCGGTISGPASYGLTHAGRTGAILVAPLAPGASVDLDGVTLQHRGSRRAEDLLSLQLSAPGDADPASNTYSARVRFAYCDLTLSAFGALDVLPSEGARSYALSVRNTGTAPCADVRIAVARGGRRSGTGERFTVPAGRSVSEELTLAVPRRRAGARSRVAFRAVAAEDVEPANDAVALNPSVVGVGDTTILAAGRLGVRGTAGAGRGRVAARRLRVTGVEVAIRRVGGGCRWLASRSGRFKSVKGGSACARRMLWLPATGDRSWRLLLTRPLPAGRYEAFSRATIVSGGFREGVFTARDRNRVAFRVPGDR